MKEEDKEVQDQQVDVQSGVQNLYALEIQFQDEVPESTADKQSTGDIESELKSLRRANRKEVGVLQESVQKLEDKLHVLVQRRFDMEESIVKR